MDKVFVGKHHEKRGEDILTVYKSVDGDVVQIQQYDAHAAFNKIRDISLWAESVPALITLLQKAAGVKDGRVEYEYTLKRTRLADGNVVIWDHLWDSKKVTKQRLADYTGAEEEHEAEHGFRYATYRMVKRIKAGKAGPVENA